MADGGATYFERFQRTYILGVLSFGSFAQSLAWFTFSSVDAHKFGDYYRGSALPQGVDREQATTQLRILLNWGPLAGMLFFPLGVWLLTRPKGLRLSVLAGLGLTALGSFLRFIPTFLSNTSSRPFAYPGHAVSVYGSPLLTLSLLHISQILIGFAGPFVMGCVSRLAVVWFPQEQRITATAIGQTSNAVGVTVGFVLGPWLAPVASDYPTYLLWTLVLSAAPLLAAAVYYPDAPLRPPSAAAAAWAAAEADQGGFVEGMKMAVSNCSYAALVLAAGILAGSGAAWQAVLQDTLAPVGYSDSFVGYLGFANSLGLNVGSVAAGAAASTRPFRRRFKLVLVLGMVSMLVSGVAWALNCNRAGSEGLLLTLVSIMGLGNGVANPFFYELGAEITYPAPEGTSAGILVMLWNLTTVAIVFLPASLCGTMNWIYLGLILVCLVLVLGVKEQYLRPADTCTLPTSASITVDCRPLTGL